MDFNKPRVAIYYHVLPSTGMRNDGGPLFINYNLRKIVNKNTNMADDTGNVVHLWPDKNAELFGKFDLHVWVDYGEDGLDVPLDWTPKGLKAYWCSDAHISEKSYDYRLKRAKEFDYVFVAQKDFIEKFVKDGIPRDKIFYLPHAVEPDVYRPYPIIERWDWAFIGHMNNMDRIELVDRFCKEWPVGINGYLGWRMPEMKGWNVLDDVAKKFSQSRIVLNENIMKDVNMRTFEAMACKRLLLTENIPELHDLFEDGKHLVMFNSVDEAVEKAKYYLAHDEERLKIAEAGYKEVMAKHTYHHRALEILKTCLNYVPEKSGQEVVNAH